jgi:exopolysaccharide production protein ExoY
MKVELNKTGAKRGLELIGETEQMSIDPSDQVDPVLYWKRGLDLACLLISLPILLPIMFLIAVGIKLTSPGPVIFRQERVGYRGRRFRLYKFRSMEVCANPEAHVQHMGKLMESEVPMEKLDGGEDPRLICWGRFLRASGLDELPQVINILRGEMSLVGPRPCTTYEYDRYHPWHKRRFNALPGITGLWQVSGKNRTTFKQMVYLDITYARNRSLWLDLRILAKTVFVPIQQIHELDIDRTKTSKPAVSVSRERKFTFSSLIQW